MHEHPWPKTAEALMRSRFAAVRDADAEWLLASWHPSTRPASLDLTDNPAWRGLQIIDTVAGGPDDDTGIVEFRATYLVPGGGVGSSRSVRGSSARAVAGTTSARCDSGTANYGTYSAAIGPLSSAASRPSPYSLPGAPTRR